MASSDDIITGNTLIDWGYSPSIWFRQVLDYIQDNKLSKQEALLYLEQNYEKESEVKEIKLHEQPINFTVNIRPENPLEQHNVNTVLQTMQKVMQTPTVVSGIVMPDACPAGIPVGGVVATQNAIHPGMHSADICCSLMYTDYGNIDPKVILDAAQSIIHFGPGGRDRSSQFRIPQSLLESFDKNSFLNDK